MSYLKNLSSRSRLLYILGALNVVAVLIYGIGTVLADGTELDAGPRVFPYNGVLELDGRAYTGQADFRFALTDEGACNFAEDHEEVDVYGGRFAVNIGGVVGSVPPCVFDADAVFINVSVREATDEAEHRPLSGRQRIHPVPFAYWAAEGSDFKVDGNLTVSGNISDPDPARSLTIDDGLLVTQGATVQGDFNINGGLSNSASDLRINDSLDITGDIQDVDGPVIINDGLEIRGDTDIINGGDLSVAEVNGLASINPGGSAFSAGGDVTVNGSLTTATNLVADNNTHGSCSWVNWKRIARNCNEGDDTCNDSTNPPDSNNLNQLVCPNGRFMVGADLTHPNDRTNANDIWFSIFCCEL